MKSYSVSVLFLLAVCSAYAQSNSDVDRFIDSWHLAASKADAETFFGGMAEDAIYIGTDATERWTKTQFVTFAKPYFDKGKAWDFKPRDREVHVTSNKKVVWFSELLDTWMGVCRGSGVLVRTRQGWKVQQYHLSVTVPNDVIKDFIALVDNFENNPKKP